MGSGSESVQVSPEALQAVAVLQQLTFEAGLCLTRQELVFHILNRTILFARYDRAVLWGLTGCKPYLLGVSADSTVNHQAPLVGDWRELVKEVAELEDAVILQADRFQQAKPCWERVAQQVQGLSVAWLPLVVEGQVLVGLWLERWEGRVWSEGEMRQLAPLATGYSIAWRCFARSRSWFGRWALERFRWLGVLVAAGLIAALCFVRVPLRVIAPCEVVPKHPIMVTASLRGVIDEVLVQPGQVVGKNALLAVYGKRVALEELKVAWQQVEIVRSDLQRARVHAFDDRKARAQTVLLENRLEQELTRLALAEYRAGQLEVKAPRAGTVMIEDPETWRGQPVQVGERIMMLVEPSESKVRIWLPQDDNIHFDEERYLTIILNADPRSALTARLTHIGRQARDGPAGIPVFPAEGEWLAATSDVKLGLKGTAVLYGRDVSLGYWLLRKPWASLRQFLGL